MMILDTYCCQGGAAVGLARTFPKARIVGVDIKPQPRYPFEFYEADALWFIETYGRQFDFIWASPPCQAYSYAAKGWTDIPRPDLVAPTRLLLRESGRPYIIENVVGAPLVPTVTLCGTMFDLRVFRHRLFEANFPIEQPEHPSHAGRIGTNRGDYVTVVDGGIMGARVGFGKNDYVSVAGHGGDGTAILKRWKLAMGIDWMDRYGITQAVPPAYSEYLARYVP